MVLHIWDKMSETANFSQMGQNVKIAHFCLYVQERRHDMTIRAHPASGEEA